MLLAALVVCVIGSVVSASPKAEGSVYAYARESFLNQKKHWYFIPGECSTTEAGANDGLVRCTDSGEPGDTPLYALPPIDSWHSPVAILD